MRAAARIRAIPGSGIREVMAKAQALRAAGKDVINWHIGRPDFDTPKHIKEACTAAMAAGHVHYAPAAGLPALRAAIAAQCEREWSSPAGGVSPERVVVCNGGMEAVYATLATLMDEGDEVILPSPSWPNVRWAASLVGANPVEVPLRDGLLQAEDVAKAVTEKTKVVVLASPGNPTGTTADMGSLRKFAALAKERDLLLISDDTYSRLYYGGEQLGQTAPALLSIDGMEERCISISTFSKTYAMDGWRLGWAVAPTASDATLIAKARYYISACSPTFTQHAAVTALTGPQDCVMEMVAAYDARRRVLLDGLADIEGVSLPGGNPDGAFYVFPDVSRLGSSAEIAARLLDEHHIACIDGGVFGAEGEGYLRIAYSCSLEDCRKGVELLATALRSMR